MNAVIAPKFERWIWEAAARKRLLFAMTGLKQDWTRIAAELDEQGWALLPGLLDHRSLRPPPRCCTTGTMAFAAGW